MEEKARLSILIKNEELIESRHNNISIHQGGAEQAQLYLDIRTNILKESEIAKGFIEKRKDKIEKFISNELYSFFLVKNVKEVIGYIEMISGDLPTNQHIGHIKLNTIKSYRLAEIQRRMLMFVEGYAISDNIKRLQLIVPQSDFQMVNVIISLGFRIEGKLNAFFHSEDVYSDGYLMAKII